MSAKRTALRRQIEQRRRELHRAFMLAQHEGPLARRARLEAELSLVDWAVRRGWDRVSEVAADALGHWLETTQSLLA